jgi:hypothetical protein
MPHDGGVDFNKIGLVDARRSRSGSSDNWKECPVQRPASVVAMVGSSIALDHPARREVGAFNLASSGFGLPSLACRKSPSTLERRRYRR